MKDSCQKTMVFVLFASSIIFLMSQGIPYLESTSFDEKECVIQNVTYPQSIEDRSNLIKCDCGRYCTSDTGTCIRIRGNLVSEENNNMRLFVSSTSINKPREDCTFAEVKCPKGEKIEDRLKSVEAAQNKASEYIQKINKNITVPCYQRSGDPYLYLEKHDNSILFYVSVGLFVLTCSCMCCVCCSCPCRDSEDRNQSAFI